MSSGPTATPAVEVRGVSRSFGGRRVLDDVSLSIRAGEFFALLGPSGSGKSTLLRMVSGIDVPDQGEVWLSGRDVTSLPPFRRPVHTVFQNYALFPHLDVVENVGFPLRVAGVSAAERAPRVLEALGWVQMDRHARRRVVDLSGGEKQRVALARALIDEPECVLLDEPLSALDPHLRGQTMELLQGIQSRLGATYLYVTHDRSEALRAADRMAVMKDGRLMQVGPPEEVYRGPSSPFVAGFVGPIGWMTGTVDGAGSSTIRLDAGPRIPVDVAVADGTRVLVGVRPENVRLEADGFFEGTVVKRHYEGSSIKVEVEFGDGGGLTADLPADGRDVRAGDRIGVRWNAADSHLFAADGLPPEQSTAARLPSSREGEL